MNCPKCGKKAKRIQGGYSKTSVIRYCLCPSCMYLFSTQEVIQGNPEDVDLRISHVIKTVPLTRTTIRYRIMPGSLIQFETLESEVKKKNS